DGGITRRRHRVAVGEVADVAVDLSGCGSRDEVRRRVLQAVGTRSRYVRVTLHGELDAGVDLNLRDLAHAAAHLPGVVVRVGEVRTGYDLQAIAAEATVRGQFVRQVQAAPELSEAMKRRVLTTGLRALDGRDDLEVV
ncbi:MAG TPA: metallophosphoesterase, partial [Chloroflexota bacterium]|nr:metallophosphoesterase [Chloroflexota bacterium]